MVRTLWDVPPAPKKNRCRTSPPLSSEVREKPHSSDSGGQTGSPNRHNQPPNQPVVAASREVHEEPIVEVEVDRLVPEGFELAQFLDGFGIGDDDFGAVAEDFEEDDVTDRVVPPSEDNVTHGENDTTDRVVPPSEHNDNVGEDATTEGEVHPADFNADCGIEEEECDDMMEQFGVNEGAEDKGLDSDAPVDDDDDKIPEPLSSDDDDEAETDRNNDDHVSDDRNELLKLGKCFCTPEDFRIAILKYSLRSRYDIKLYISQATKIGAKCNDKDGECQWRCYASYEKKKHKMQIKVFVDVHTCVRSGYSKMLKQGTVAWLFSERLRINPRMKKQEMAEAIKREYNLVVSDEVCGKAKTMLAKQRKQSHETHFSRIWDYQAEVLLSNEGSSFEIETISGPTIGSKQRFYRLFMCFKSQRESWKTSCRPIIGVDGAFLRWDIKGHLLAAVGRDANNMIVPIAWAIVEIESEPNWDWFIRLLSGNLGLGDGRNLAILSDKQKGLVKAIHEVLPQAEYRQCARHIMDNWKRDSHDMELQRLFWKIARSYNQGEFAANMDALRNYNVNSYNSLLRTNPATWSRAFFRIGSCCGDVLNNLCESFNRTIKAARRKPLLELLEDIRRQCMVRNENRSRITERLQTRFTERAHDEIEKMVAGSQFCILHMARNNLYEVDLGGVAYRVNMNDFTCGCRKWQITGIPCVHAAAVIIRKKQKVEDYVSEYYTAEMWRKTYKDGIGPVQGELLWPRLNRLGVLPPPWRKGNPGRPSNYARKRGINESQQPPTKMTRRDIVITCSNCHQDGHNKSTCANEKVVPPPKKPRGRPKKTQEPEVVLFGQGSQATRGQSSQGQSSQGQQGSHASQVQRTHGQGQSSQGHRTQGQGQSSQGCEGPEARFIWSVFG